MDKRSVERNGNVGHEQEGDIVSASEGIAAAGRLELGFVNRVWITEKSR